VSHQHDLRGRPQRPKVLDARAQLPRVARQRAGPEAGVRRRQQHLSQCPGRRQRRRQRPRIRYRQQPVAQSADPEHEVRGCGAAAAAAGRGSVLERHEPLRVAVQRACAGEAGCGWRHWRGLAGDVCR